MWARSLSSPSYYMRLITCGILRHFSATWSQERLTWRRFVALPERVSAHPPVCVVAPRCAGVCGSVPTALPNQRVVVCPRFTYLPMCVASIPAARPMLVAMSPSRGRVCLVLL